MMSKGGDKDTEEVLQAGAEKEGEEWAFMKGRKVQRLPVKGKQKDEVGEMTMKMNEKWIEEM